MSNIEIAGFQSHLIEELDDADLMAVVGGGLVDGLVTGVAATNNAIGNGGRPTTGAVGLVAKTVTEAGQYLGTVNGGLEGGLQSVNATVDKTATQV